MGGVAISNVQSIDLNNSRNAAILGFSILVGLIVPGYYKRNQFINLTGKILCVNFFNNKRFADFIFRALISGLPRNFCLG